MVWRDFNFELCGSIPNFPQKNIDPTFIASVFTGVLIQCFGIQTAKNKNAAAGGGGANISKKDMEMLIEKATQAAPAQTIRLEQAPMVIAPDPLARRHKLIH